MMPTLAMTALDLVFREANALRLMRPSLQKKGFGNVRTEIVHVFMEILLLRLGGAVAKSVLSLWLGSNVLLGNMSETAVDTLVDQIPNLGIIERRRLARQFQRMAEAVAEKLAPFLEVEFGGLPENERIAAVLAVADAIERANVTSQLLLSQDLDPLRLEDHVRAGGMRDRALLIPAAGVLYDHLLREACNYAVEIAVTLPPFPSQAARESLRRESEIIDLIYKVLSKLPDAAPAGHDDTYDDHQFETQYRRTVARRLDYLELFGLDVSPFSKRYALSVAYITLSTTDPSGGEDESEYVRVNEALAGSRRMLIRGDAGSGKTTLLQWLAVAGARKSYDGALVDWNDSVPFFIRLRRYAGQALPQPEDFVAAIAPAEAGRMPDGWAHRQLESGRALVLIDGVDELSDDDRQRAREWLLDLTATFENACYVVTSRPSTPEDWLIAADFQHCALQPMTLGDVRSFVEHWYNAIRSALPDAADQAELDQMSAGLMAILRSRPPLRGLATNPLLCAMICALHRERSEQLPEDRMELYRVALELLLERRDIERRVLPDGMRLTLTEKQIFLRDIAYWLVLNNYVDAEEEDIVQRIAQKLPSMQRIRDNASTVYRYLLERSGVLRAPTVGRVDFVHRTFQEYLAAEEAVEQGHIGVLIENAQHDQWREVVVLGTGHATVRQREALLRGLLDRGNREPNQRHRLHLLACACLETSPELPPELIANLRDVLSRLVPPKNMTEARALASAGQLAVGLLGGFMSERARVVVACVRALALIGGDDALDVIASYGSDGRSTVMEELIHTWSSLWFDPNEFGRRVLANSRFTDWPDLVVDNVSLIPSLRYLPRPYNLTIRGRLTQSSLDEMQGIPSPIVLSIVIDDELNDLFPVGTLSDLNDLYIHNCLAVSDLSPFSNLTLTRLRLTNCRALADIAPLADVRSLSRLVITQAILLKDLSALAACIQLSQLDLSGCGVVDLTPLAGLIELNELNLNGCPIVDLGPLAGLANLKQLSLGGSPVTDLAPLANLTQLHELNVANSPVADLRPVANLHQLRGLGLDKCPITDLAPLTGLTNLRSLSLSYIPALLDPALESFLNSLESLYVSDVPDNLISHNQWHRINAKLLLHYRQLPIDHA
jgi:Leucine-rich repeat (LRR) protein